MNGLLDHSLKPRELYIYFALPPGLYEINVPIFLSGEFRRKFYLCEDGKTHKISKEDAIECLKKSILE